MPQTLLGWWAVGLAGTFWVLQATQGWVFTAIAMESLSGVEQWLVIWALVLPGVAGTVVASIALLRGLDRSALVWLVTAFLSAGWLVLVFVGMNWPGEIPTLLVMAALVVLINLLIAWLGLHRSGRPR